MKKTSSFIPKDLANTAALGGGVFAGNFVAPAVSGAVLDFVKPNSNTKKGLTLAVVGVLAITGAAYIKNTGVANAIGKGALVGFGGTSVAEAVRTFTADTPAVQKLAAKSTPIGKIVGRISGLGCPCDNNPMLNGARRNKRRGRGMGIYLPTVTEDFAYPLNASVNSLESIVNGGGLLSA